MKNGNAIGALIEETSERLDSIKVIEYFPQPIPSPLDNWFDQVMGRLTGMTAVSQQQFQEALPAELRSLFGIFGHRAATWAARTENVDLLKKGLLATAVANHKIPKSRRVEIGLAVFYHVARKLEQNPVDLFEEVAQFASDDMAEALLKFGKSGPVNIRNYGWREIKTDDGIRYKWG